MQSDAFFTDESGLTLNAKRIFTMRHAVSLPFNLFRDMWLSRSSKTIRACSLVAIFLGGLAVIELRRLSLLGDGSFAEAIPTNHLASIRWTVSVILVFEIVRLVLVLERSVANMLSGQLEVYSLILLRDAFIPLESFGEPLNLTGQSEVVMAMIADATGAILLFLICQYFMRLQQHQPITEDDTSSERFVAIKKIIATGLLLLLLGLIIADARMVMMTGKVLRVFDIFFTVFVFVDVLLALVSMSFSRSHPVVFRNFGFAFVAVLLRLALAAPEFARPALGVEAGVFAVFLTVVYNYAMRGTFSLIPSRSGQHGSSLASEVRTPSETVRSVQELAAVKAPSTNDRPGTT